LNDWTVAVFIALALYFGVGVLALVGLNAFTKKLWSRAKESIADVQIKMSTSGEPVGHKTAAVLLIVALWLFWPVAVFGSLTRRRE